MHANACYLCSCRGKGKAMTQKTFSLLWWSRWHLGWADHVFKVGVLIFFWGASWMPRPIFLDVRLWTNLMQQSIICENDCFLYSQIDTDTFVNFARLAQVRSHFTCTIVSRWRRPCMIMHKTQPESHSTSAPMQVLMPTANNSSLHWIGPLHGIALIVLKRFWVVACTIN